MSRILLADDSPHAQRMGELILREEGHEVVTVTDGQTAMVRLGDVQPDLILVHINIPHRSGYDVCDYVKRSPRHRHTKVVLTAGALESFDDEEVQRVGADGTLRKPFEASVVLETIKPLLEAVPSDKGETEDMPSEQAPYPVPTPRVTIIDPERVRAAVTLALDASMVQLVDQITEKVLVALSPHRRSGAS